MHDDSLLQLTNENAKVINNHRAGVLKKGHKLSTGATGVPSFFFSVMYVEDVMDHQEGHNN
jgi:hypothetical protein